MSIAIYEAALEGGPPVFARRRDGSVRAMDVSRWQATAGGADNSVIERVTGSVLDIGCGPGRMLEALTRRGLPALGIDVSAAAVRLARRRGTDAVLGSVFGEVPHSGTWEWALLADGNIGIGGRPEVLLRRVARLLRPGGRVVVETGPPQMRSARLRLRLEDATGSTGHWFGWAEVGAGDVAELGRPAGLRVTERWSAPDHPDSPRRWFVTLATGVTR